MIVEQLYTQCLAQGAYYVESEGEAAIIDPLREVQPYIDLAARRGAVIRYIFETHFHADFVSGHVDLARKTGATIVYGPTTVETGFKALIAQDGQVFGLGQMQVRLLHTPGHTMESSCFLLSDEQQKPVAIFTGDTLFIGDVGRPDLAQKVNAALTPEILAGHLYDSLRQKLLPLPDDIVVYPGHGAGSACGKNMSRETFDTLGHQKQVNYALQLGLDRDSFVRIVLDGLTPPPGYFPQNVLLNIRGYAAIDEVMQRGMTPLSLEKFEAERAMGVLVLDTRRPGEFVKGFVPGSWNIGLDGNFAVWVGTLVPDVRSRLLLIIEPGREAEVFTRLARVGYDQAAGYLEGGFETWQKAGKALDTIESISATQLADRLTQGNLSIIDVRKASEFDSQHVEAAENHPLDYWTQSYNQIDRDGIHYVHCAGGYRSVIFISLMRTRGYRHLIHVEGGFNAMTATGRYPLSQYVCPTSML